MRTRSEATVVGYLAKDPQIIVKENAKFANLVVGTNETFTKKNGEKESHVTWHDVAIYSDFVINNIAVNLKKGSAVSVLGTIKQYDKIVQTVDGEKRIPMNKIVVSSYFGDVFEIVKPSKKEIFDTNDLDMDVF